MPQTFGRAKPFVKWAGGKGQLLAQLTSRLPADFPAWSGVCYVEPFVGGGAMLFHMLQTYPGITRAVVGDLNDRLTAAYLSLRDRPRQLIAGLRALHDAYLALPTQTERKDFYLSQRQRFNARTASQEETAALLIFLNRTCFNGLYRENRSGGFNVPFGRYERPCICDEPNLLACSRLLQRVEIHTGDFETLLPSASGPTFVYLDPPYRPLSATSHFNTYSKTPFADSQQQRLARFCDRLTERGCHLMLSNADCLTNAGDDFFERLYRHYHIGHVYAARSINAHASGRGPVSEIVVTNYPVGEGVSSPLTS